METSRIDGVKAPLHFKTPRVTDSVDRALDLARAVRRTRDTVRCTEPEVVLAVRREDNPVRLLPQTLPELLDERTCEAARKSK